MGAAIDPHWSLQQQSHSHSQSQSKSTTMSPWASSQSSFWALQERHPEPILIGSAAAASSSAAAVAAAAAEVAAKRAIDSGGAGVRKKQRAAPQAAAAPTCQVEGCNADLTGCKGYHRRHRVCEMHSKSPRSMVAGAEQRFCQQCSRFHPLAEFDEGKRSCRRRLAGHNERRRKPPQPDLFSMHSMPIFSAGSEKQHIMDGTFLLNANDGSIWPGFHKSGSEHPPVNYESAAAPSAAAAAGLHFYVQNPSKQGLLALRESIATQGVYQFLKCHNATVAPSSVAPSSSPTMSAAATNPPSGALSLLSLEQQSPAAAAAAVAAASSMMLLNTPAAPLLQLSSPTSMSSSFNTPDAAVKCGPLPIKSSSMSSLQHPQQQQQQQFCSRSNVNNAANMNASSTSSSSSLSNSEFFMFQKTSFESSLPSSALVFDC